MDQTTASHALLGVAAGASLLGWSVTGRALRTARTDDRTGLPIRCRWTAIANRWLRWHPGPLRVAVLDLDDFKIVNDSRGHGVGDWVLAETARRVTTALPAPARCLATRLGGDEFALLVSHPRPGDLAALRAAICAPVELPGGAAPVPVSASVGSVLTAPWPRSGSTTVDALLGAADEAMYARKRARHGDLARHAAMRT